MSYPFVAPLDQLKQRDLRKRFATPRVIEPLEHRRLFAASVVDDTLTITGTEGDDTITFTRTGPDEVTATVNGQATAFDLDDFYDLVIEGLGGNDHITIADDTGGDDRSAATVNSGAGNDTIEGGDSWYLNYDAGAGDDHVTAGARASSGYLGAGNDTFVGGAAADQVWGDSPGDTLAGAGNDLMTGNGGDDELFGEAGNDSLDGGDGDDEATGEAGNDTVIGGAGFDILDGGAGTDSVVGNAADDALFNGENPGGDDNTVSIDAGGIIRVVGTSKQDLIAGRQDGGLVTIEFGRASKAFPEAQVNGVHVDAGAGNDYVSFKQNVNFFIETTVLGGEGDDFLIGGSVDDVVSGGAGNDELDGWRGDDLLVGGTGDDTLEGGDGTDTLDGGAGFNAFRYGEVNSGGTFLPGLRLDEQRYLRFDGTDADDDLVIWRIAENRFAISINGATQTLGGFSEIFFFGNGGNDELRINSSITQISRIEGGDGNDTLSGGGNNDRIFGGPGDDQIFGNAARDILVGDEGNDTLDGGAGDDTLTGGPGDDTLLNGETNRPSVSGVTLEDGILTFDGQSSDEQVSLWSDGAGGLVIWVDGESDVVDLSAVTRIELSGNGGNDLLKLHKNLAIPAMLNGGTGDDKLIGGASDDTLLGVEGNDHLTGNNGDDLLDGGLGSDAMIGNGGKDTVDYSTRTANLVIGLDALADDGEIGENDLASLDIERVLAGSGNDRIGGSAANNELYGGAGNDTIGGGGGDDALFGAGGNDKLDGGDDDDYLEGGAGHDLLYGGAGSDTLTGQAGNDRFFSSGDGETDLVSGGLGTDTGNTDDDDELTSIETVV